MKLLLQSAMVFFGTLMAAALVALAEPGSVELTAAQQAATAIRSAAQVLASSQPGDIHGATAREPPR